MKTPSIIPWLVCSSFRSHAKRPCCFERLTDDPSLSPPPPRQQSLIDWQHSRRGQSLRGVVGGFSKNSCDTVHSGGATTTGCGFRGRIAGSKQILFPSIITLLLRHPGGGIAGVVSSTGTAKVRAVRLLWHKSANPIRYIVRTTRSTQCERGMGYFGADGP